MPGSPQFSSFRTRQNFHLLFRHSFRLLTLVQEKASFVAYLATGFSPAATGFIVSGSRKGNSVTGPLVSSFNVTGWSGSFIKISLFWPTTRITALSGVRYFCATRCTSSFVTASMRAR